MNIKITMYALLMMSLHVVASNQSCSDTNSTKSTMRGEWIDSNYEPKMELDKGSIGCLFGLLQGVIVPEAKLLQAQAQGKKLTQSEAAELQVFNKFYAEYAQQGHNLKDSIHK